MSEGFIWTEDWLLDARCGGQYGAFDGSLCADCPVRGACLQHALEAPWRPYGVWAGKTEDELLPLWKELHPNRTDEVLELIGMYRDERGREPGKEVA